MANSPDNTDAQTERNEGIISGLAVAGLLILSLLAMAAPDPVMGRHAPLQVEAVR